VKRKRSIAFLALLSLMMLVGCATQKVGDGAAGDSSAAKVTQPRATPKSVQTQAPVASVANNESKKDYQALMQAHRNRRDDQVVAEASRILQADPNDITALNALAMQQFRRGRVGAAKLLLNRGLERSPNNASLLNNLAVIQISESESRLAMQTLKRAFRSDDKNPHVLANLGSLYVQGGDYVKALPLLEQAYGKLESQTSLSLNYAIALSATKSFERAARIYEEILKSSSRDVEAHLAYGALLIEQMGKYKEGLAHVTRVKFLETERKDILDRANELEKRARNEIK